MYKISDTLEQQGFSVNKMEDCISQNNHSYNFETLEYFVIYIAFVDSEISIDNRKYEIRKNHLVFIPPHKKIIYSESCFENFVITFSSTFYEKSVKDSFILNSELFFSKNSEIVITPAIGNEYALKSLIVNRLELYKDKDYSIYISVAHNCVEILLLDGLLYIDTISNEIVNTHSLYIETVNRFRILLQKYYKTQKKVSFYSEALCVSPQRLSVMTKTVLGKGAKRMVVDKIASEAQKMIKNSILNISEIANELGFEDEANFSTFIRKNFGKSPSELRFTIMENEKKLVE